MSNYILMLDIDEVLVDFRRGACKAHGADPEKVNQLNMGRWDMIEPLSQALGLEAPMKRNEFWAPIEREGSLFWGMLEETPYCDKVLSWADEEFRDNWFLVSSPHNCVTSYTGKVSWIKNKFGKSFDRFFLTSHKELLAKPDRVLVDDSKHNVDKFVCHGGQGIVFPTLAVGPIQGCPVERVAEAWIATKCQRRLNCTSGT